MRLVRKGRNEEEDTGMIKSMRDQMISEGEKVNGQWFQWWSSHLVLADGGVYWYREECGVYQRRKSMLEVP